MTYQFVTFKDKKYNIDDDKTAKNLTQMQEGEIEKLTRLVNDYKKIVEYKTKSLNECQKTNVKLRDINKRLEKEIKESDNLLSISIDEKKIIEKEKDKIKNSIEMFFRLNENIIKEF
jgi:septal ring factor EnvC (AmiA/AmiB activator)|tara:strand:+ start:577 stop:927 length:351 start_codon:yes stop_codon:yes gene_type:complete